MSYGAVEVTAEEMEDLLLELEQVGGKLSNDSTISPPPPRSAGRGGKVTSMTSLEGVPQRGGLGLTNATISPHKRLPGMAPPSPSHAGATSTAHHVSSQFSTYNTGLSERDVLTQRRVSAPLSVRLPPLTADTSAGSPRSSSPSSRRTPRKDAGAGPRRSSRDPQPALPMNLSGSSLMPEHAGDQRPPATAGLDETKLLSEAAPPLDVRRPVNFLPIMCARYVQPAGLTPSPRWGHTLTAVNPLKLLMFGGMAASGGETATFMELNPVTLAWEPGYTASGTIPTARYGHAACAYEGRYLLVHGGATKNGRVCFGDIHQYDLHTQSWCCLWEGGAADNEEGHKDVPAPRYGHTMLLHEDRLYICGGRVVKTGSAANTGSAAGASPATTTLASADVYVFSLNSLTWKRRIRADKRSTARGTGEHHPADGLQSASTTATTTVPANRSHHAGCVLDGYMYINGGSGPAGATLADTWALHLRSGRWQCLHDGGSADAYPREKHALFACGEALLVVGGCGTSAFNERVAGQFYYYASLLPLRGQAEPCWIPIAMGNRSIVAPSTRGFAAAFNGGFVYSFGGTHGSEPASNSLVRFLATDGWATEAAQSGHDSGRREALRCMMQRAQEGTSGAPPDVLIVLGTSGSGGGGDGGTVPSAGVHRALLMQRAPRLWAELQTCRSEVRRGSQHAAQSSSSTAPAPGARDAPATGHGAMEDFLNDVQRSQTATHAESVSQGAPSALSQATVYYTVGNSRVKGLTHPRSARELACLVNYLYWGGLSSEYRVLLREDEEAAETTARHRVRSPLLVEKRTELTSVVESLGEAAKVFDLGPLQQLCAALLRGRHETLHEARAASAAVLHDDLMHLLESAQGASMTVLFVDPYTRHHRTQALHPVVLMAASTLFAELLRPLLLGGATSSKVGGVAAKVTISTARTVNAASKRAILVGPVVMPHPAVPVVLRYLYSQDLRVPSEVALEVLIGAHALQLPLLQASSETMVAREEVNYDTCCTYLTLARRYNAPLLEEMSLLTAVSGYASLQQSLPYKHLPAEERARIDAVAAELGSEKWVPPPQPATEMKAPEEYAARWSAATPLS